MIKFLSGAAFGLVVALIGSAIAEVVPDLLEFRSVDSWNAIMMTGQKPDGKPSVIKVNEDGYVICAR